MIDCMLFKATSTLFKLYRSGQCTYPCFPDIHFDSTPKNILSKPLATFPHNHHRNNGQLCASNECCRNEYHPYSERIFADPGIETATSCSRVLHAID